MDEFEALAKSIERYLDRGGENELGACKPAQEILLDLTTIIEGDMGNIDTTQMGWANDVEAFCSAAP